MSSTTLWEMAAYNSHEVLKELLKVRISTPRNSEKEVGLMNMSLEGFS